MVTRPDPTHLGGLASSHGVNPDRDLVLGRGDPPREQFTPALTLPQVRYGLSLLCSRCSAHPASTPSVAKYTVNYCATSWPDSTIITPVSVCHHGSYAETYSKFIYAMHIK
jgi:hypothetical protein